MSTSVELNRHPLLQYVLEELRPALLGFLDGMPKDRSALKKWQAENRAALTKPQEYCRWVLYRNSNLLRIFDRLDQAAFLIGRSPASHSTRRRSINRNDWTEYHFSAFTTALGSVVDCCLILVAEVYQLGLPPRQCTFDTVTSNKWVAGSPACKAMQALNRSLQGHTERRNRYLHRGDEADFSELTNSDFLADLRSLTLVHSMGEYPIDQRVLRAAWRAELLELRPMVDAAVQAASEGTSAVLSALLVPLKHRVKLLGILDGPTSGGERTG